MNSPLFSIVIPTFNSLPYIGECVRSALQQTYRNVEVVVDDNASQDGTVKLLRSQFGEMNNFRLFENKEDLNIPHGWNRAINHSSGEFVLLLHSDNLLHPQYVEVAMSLIERQKTAVVFSDCHYFPNETPLDLFSALKDTNSVRYSRLCSGQRAVAYAFRFQRMIPTSALSFRRDLFSHRPFYDPNYAWDPDMEQLTWLASNYGFLHVPLPLAAIRTHDGQARGWRDPSFSMQYFHLLKLQHEAGQTERFHFLSTWASSNRDLSTRLAEVQGSWRWWFTYTFRWGVSEAWLLLHSASTFARSLMAITSVFFLRLRKGLQKPTRYLSDPVAESS